MELAYNELLAALKRIAEFDCTHDGEEAFDEWSEAQAFRDCQGIAREALQTTRAATLREMVEETISWNW
jgi:hypothetical protein